MILSVRNLTLTVGIVTLSSLAMAQKKNETSAAVEFKNKFLPAYGSGDFETAKKSLKASKEYVDLAAANAETENSQKTLWLKGEIYSYFPILGLQTMDTAFANFAGPDAIEVSTAAFKKGYPISKKMHPDFENSVEMKAAMFGNYAGTLFENNQFEGAGQLYETIANYRDAIQQFDSSSIFNAALSYDRAKNFEKAAGLYEKDYNVGYKGTSCAIYASRAYGELGNKDKAKAIINDARTKNPTDKDLLLELVNMNIAAGDAAGAEKALSDAIAADPNNKQLYYTIGTIYIDLKENAKAEQSLEKALEIDPNYIDAMYQLGAHLFNWSNDLVTEANNLKIGDPRFNELKALSEEKMDKALVYLEKYIPNDPENKAILNILYQGYHKRGNAEKAKEYKARFDKL